MTPILETRRLILREVDLIDQNDLFEMDSDPAVHRYLGQNPVTSVEYIRTVIGILQQQYIDNGIARWAVVRKENKECIGWAGLKFFKGPIHGLSNFYDLGYRFKQKYWGQGYATECGEAITRYGFEHFDIESIYAQTNPENHNSKKVLGKLNFNPIGSFIEDEERTDWFELKRENHIQFHL